MRAATGSSCGQVIGSTRAPARWRFPGRRRCTWWRAPAAWTLAQLQRRGAGDARARHAERMAERDRAAIRVHVLRVLGDAEFAQHRDALGGKGFVEFDDVEIGRRRGRAARASFRVAGTGPMPMMRGATPAVAPPSMRAIGVRPYFLAAASEATISAAAPSLTPEALPAVTVPPSRNGVGSLASVSTVVPARGCSSLATTIGVALALRDRHRRDLLGQPAVGLRGDGLVLAAHGERVLVGARHREILGDVLAGLRHGIDAVLLLHQRVDEAPADRRVVDLGVARERLGRPWA